MNVKIEIHSSETETRSWTMVISVDANSFKASDSEVKTQCERSQVDIWRHFKRTNCERKKNYLRDMKILELKMDHRMNRLIL